LPPRAYQAAPQGPVAPPRPTGPTVEIVRGTKPTTYEVNRHGS